VVASITLEPIPERILADEKEIALLLAFPTERLASIVHEIRFSCTCCAQCCTRSFNDHVFLLDRDTAVVREIDPDALEPAPLFEFCDQHGVFYVSGYALRAKDDSAGSCWFLENNRCRIYRDRLSICRIYPYMLHREPDDSGFVDWRQIAGPDLHGEYHTDIPFTTCMAIAGDVKEYEEAFLRHEIAFLQLVQEYFRLNRLRHVQKVYDDRMRGYAQGEQIVVRVYHAGDLEEVTRTRKREKKR
jgi:Fe-S-cluster containining protein